MQYLEFSLIFFFFFLFILCSFLILNYFYRFLRGTCKINGCPFSHEVDPGKMAICSFFLVGQCDKEHCPYRHEKLSQNAVLCKDFVQGYCCNGKEVCYIL